MKRAVSGSEVIIVRVVAAAITLDDQGTQLPLSLKGVPGSQRNGRLLCFICLGFLWGSFYYLPSSLCSWTGSTTKAQETLKCLISRG